MRIIRRVDDRTRGVMVADDGFVLGYVRDIVELEGGGLQFANDFEADWPLPPPLDWRTVPLAPLRPVGAVDAAGDPYAVDPANMRLLDRMRWIFGLPTR